jgi:dolichol-phosphate mannosyltransferase
MSMRAWKRGFRIHEIPIVFVDRTEGQSKMSRAIVREAVWMVWRLRFSAMRGRFGRRPPAGKLSQERA